MALPNPGMDAVPFTPLTAEFLDDMIENIESLSDGTGFENGAITTNTLAESAVTPSKINLSSLNLGSVKVTSDAAMSGAGDIPGMSVTVNIPKGVTKIRIEAMVNQSTSGANSYFETYIQEGATKLATTSTVTTLAGVGMGAFIFADIAVTPETTHTYKLTQAVYSGAPTLRATIEKPAYMSVTVAG